MGSWRALSALTATGVLVLAACSSSADPTPSPSAPGPSESVSATAAARVSSVDLSKSIDHVHGLVATSQGKVVAGTHSGAMSVSEDGSVSAAGEQSDDLMGMSGETDTDHLVSSGHPGANSQLPNPVGLINSSDAGKEWSPVSLQGEIDFHALAVSGKDVIGFGGAALMISSDGGKSWSEGATTQVAALAYSGGNVLATTQAGLQISKDGGKKFTVVENAPVLALISAGTGTAMLGLDTSGAAWRSADSGTTWEKAGHVGEVQAIAAFDDNVGYAISENELFVIR
jgi:hypothetical protein